MVYGDFAQAVEKQILTFFIFIFIDVSSYVSELQNMIRVKIYIVIRFV